MSFVRTAMVMAAISAASGCRDELNALDDVTHVDLQQGLEEGNNSVQQAAQLEAARCGLNLPPAPLFSRAAPVAPIVERRSDGSILTRGAGRVRGRHENEESFNPFLTQYFENRSYGLEVEDYTSKGESRIKIRYLPVAQVSTFASQTNIRLWKILGNGNVFYVNDEMRKVTTTNLEYEVTRNAEQGREIRPGDVLDFEVGIFIAGTHPSDPGAISGRTAYYTDTFRYRVGTGGFSSENRDPSVGLLGPTDERARGGGDTTIPYLSATAREDHFAFSQVALNVQQSSVQGFLEGRRLFHTDFLTGEHTEPGNGIHASHVAQAGPHYAATHCSACHAHDGPGVPPAPGQLVESMVVKTFGSGVDGNGASNPDPRYGRQLQPFGVNGGEGTARVHYDERVTTFRDGTVFTLRRPRVTFENLSRGDVGAYSLRISRRLTGLGLLEALDEETILANVDTDDCDGDGISGKANVVRDPTDGVRHLGRFGWKAAKASIAHQVAEALSADMGVTTSVFPDGRPPEVDERDLDRLATYMRVLGVPARRDVDSPRVQRGNELFQSLGCTSCHVERMVTGQKHPLAELRNQVIYPYSDLLLHDMGSDLADDSQGDGAALASEWRTPPLWGLGRVGDVLCKTIPAPPGYYGDCLAPGYLHDGRARTPLEAVVWHGGEAGAARDAVLALSRADREALSAFLGSL